MSGEQYEINLEENKQRKETLFDTYEPAPVLRIHKSPPPDKFEEWIKLAQSGYIGSAYALVRRTPDQFAELSTTYEVDDEEQERILLILGRGKSEWGVPGGGRKLTETYEETVYREVAEEVGIEISITGLSHIRHEISTANGFDRRLHAFRVFFTAEYMGGSIRIQPGELNGVAWFADPPADRLLPDTEILLDDWM